MADNNAHLLDGIARGVREADHSHTSRGGRAYPKEFREMVISMMLRGGIEAVNTSAINQLHQEKKFPCYARRSHTAQGSRTLQQTYCGTISVEYMHIGSVEQCNWIRERVKHPSFLECDNEKKVHIFERLCFADTFENLSASKFNITKRFGLDGGEAIIPALKDAIDRASELGARSVIIGMPHRGRLNVLANVIFRVSGDSL